MHFPLPILLFPHYNEFSLVDGNILIGEHLIGTDLGNSLGPAEQLLGSNPDVPHTHLVTTVKKSHDGLASAHPGHIGWIDTGVGTVATGKLC